jgi:uncharacterized protein with PIN domain
MMKKLLDKYRQRCPDCNGRLQYWKPDDVRDIDSWYCKKCPNLFHRKREAFKVGVKGK